MNNPKREWTADDEAEYNADKRIKASRGRVGMPCGKSDGSQGKRIGGSCSRYKTTAIGTLAKRDRWELLFNRAA